MGNNWTMDQLLEIQREYSTHELTQTTLIISTIHAIISWGFHKHEEYLIVSWYRNFS